MPDGVQISSSIYWPFVPIACAPHFMLGNEFLWIPAQFAKTRHTTNCGEVYEGLIATPKMYGPGDRYAALFRLICCMGQMAFRPISWELDGLAAYQVYWHEEFLASSTQDATRPPPPPPHSPHLLQVPKAQPLAILHSPLTSESRPFSQFPLSHAPQIHQSIKGTSSQGRLTIEHQGADNEAKSRRSQKESVGLNDRLNLGESTSAPRPSPSPHTYVVDITREEDTIVTEDLEHEVPQTGILYTIGKPAIFM